MKISIKSDAATFEIVGKLEVMFLVASLIGESNFVRNMLSKFACFRRKNSYIQCLMIVPITLFMQIVINQFCPILINNLLPYSPTNFKELMILLFVVEIVICFINMGLLSTLNISTNLCFRFTMAVFCVILSTYLKFYNTCATINAVFIILEELKQLY